MGTETSAKVRRMPRTRRFEAEWQTGPDKFVVLSVGHAADRRMLYASLRRERADRSVGDIESRIFAPFQDIAQIDRLRVARYSAKTASAYFDQQLARVEAVRAGAMDTTAAVINAVFAVPTEA